MNMAFDLDEVLGDFWGSLSPVLHDLFPNMPSVSELSDYNGVPAQLGMTDDQFLALLIEHQVLEFEKPVKGAAEFLAGCREQGHVQVVTARGFHPRARQITEEWLNRWEIPCDDLVITGPGQPKSEHLTRNVSWFIDDAIHNVLDVKSSGRAQRTAIMVRPWNKRWRYVADFEARTLSEFAARVSR